MYDTHLFGDGDGHAVHVTAIPYGLEEWIGKAKRQNILHSFLAQIMVDPEDLRFGKAVCEDTVQLAGGFQVIADRFLDHNTRQLSVTRQPGLAEVFRDFAEHARRCGHVEDAVDLGTPFLFQLRALFTQGRISLEILEIALLVADMPGKLAPFAGFHRSLA